MAIAIDRETRERVLRLGRYLGLTEKALAEACGAKPWQMRLFLAGDPCDVPLKANWANVATALSLSDAELEAYLSHASDVQATVRAAERRGSDRYVTRDIPDEPLAEAIRAADGSGWPRSVMYRAIELSKAAASPLSKNDWCQRLDRWRQETQTDNVDLDRADLVMAEKVAAARTKRYKGRPGKYKTAASNTMNPHRVGARGECAIEKWAKKIGSKDVVPLYSDASGVDDDKADLLVSRRKIEVKSWSTGTWEEFGGSIDPDQLSTIREKAEIIIWCQEVGGAGDESVCIKIHAWTSTEDIGRLPLRRLGFDEIENFKLMSDELRSVESLRVKLLTADA